MSNKLTNEMVMESHLKEMRDKFTANRTMHDMKRKQELDFISQIKELEVLEKKRK